MKSTITAMIIGVVIILIAFWYGGHRTAEDYKNNLDKQIIIQDKNDAKVDKYSAEDMCVNVLRGRLSESGECS